MQLGVNFIIKVLEMFRTNLFCLSLVLTEIIDLKHSKLFEKILKFEKTIGIIFSFRDVCLLEVDFV